MARPSRAWDHGGEMTIDVFEEQIPDRDPLYYGSRCDRFNVHQGPAPGARLPNLFSERHQLLMRHAHLDAARRPNRPTVGIPLALSNYQLLPFWGTLLGELGLNHAPVYEKVTGPANVGALSVLLGYGVLL